MNLEELFMDTMLVAKRNPSGLIIPFDVYIDQGEKYLIVKCGQLKAGKLGKKVIDGLGRLIRLKPRYRKATNVEEYDTIIDFEEKNSIIEEGEFTNDVLSGFGRSIKGDRK